MEKVTMEKIIIEKSNVYNDGETAIAKAILMFQGILDLLDFFKE